jgi:GR25 family glycosyltransferase involved in LPS biosynthesis
MPDPHKTPSPSAWDFFDRVYCISLQSRPDRRREAKKQFAAVGLAEKVAFSIVEKDPTNQVAGIFQSHIACLQSGLAAGAETILVFEDDILFRGFDGNILAAACAALHANPDWNAFFLGCLTSGSKKTACRSLALITYRSLAHAYAVNRPFAEKIVQQKWCGIPFDDMLRRHNDRFFAISPMCAFQGLAGSDNQTVVIDRLRNLFGGLPFIQRGNEIFQKHKGAIVLLHLIVVMITIFLFRQAIAL